MQSRSYRFGDLVESLRESTSEFKPVLGKGVEEAEKATNREAYRDSKKRVEDSNKGVKSPGGNNNSEALHPVENQGMGDLRYDGDPGDKFKKNVKAGYEGYTSALDKKNHEDEPLGNASRNEKLAKAIVKHAKDVKDAKDALANSGQMTKLPGKEPDASVVESKKKINVLKFKHVQFISESHMLSHIPDEYKTEGKRFYMQDCKGDKYLVEWHSQPNIEKQLNEESVNAEMSRIKELFAYNGKNTSTTNSIRMNEGKGVDDMLCRVRGLMK